MLTCCTCLLCALLNLLRSENPSQAMEACGKLSVWNSECPPESKGECTQTTRDIPAPRGKNVVDKG
eukprot:12848662-Alexandrium_andersonii.AAC.1